MSDFDIDLQLNIIKPNSNNNQTTTKTVTTTQSSATIRKEKYLQKKQEKNSRKQEYYRNKHNHTTDATSSSSSSNSSSSSTSTSVHRGVKRKSFSNDKNSNDNNNSSSNNSNSNNFRRTRSNTSHPHTKSNNSRQDNDADSDPTLDHSQDWSSLKQRRFEGDEDVHHTTTNTTQQHQQQQHDSHTRSSEYYSGENAANDIEMKDASSSSSSHDPSSSKSSSTSTPWVRPAPKELPSIVRHTPAQLNLHAMKPVTPASLMDVISKRAVFGEMIKEEQKETTQTAANASSSSSSSSRRKFSTNSTLSSSSSSSSTSCSSSSSSQLADSKEDSSLPPLPTNGFTPFNLCPRLLRALVEKLNLLYPTKIQKESIPMLLENPHRDALIKSATGTGKTLSYLIPIIEQLAREPKRMDRSSEGTRAIILAPTRELVLQIHNVAHNLLDKSGLYWLISGVIMGGEKKKSEKSRLRKGIHLLLCTPGRLLDHLENTESLRNLKKLNWFILDEADRLWDMGFQQDLTKIIQILNERGTDHPNTHASSATSSSSTSTSSASAASTPTASPTKKPAIVDPRTGQEIKSNTPKTTTTTATIQRQNILVSATLNQEIEEIAAIALKNPIYIGFKINPNNNSDRKEDEANPSSHTSSDVIAAAASSSSTSSSSPSSSEAVVMPVGLTQYYLQVEHRHKLVALASLLRQKIVESEISQKHFKCIVYFSTCASVEFHYSLFKYSYWPYDRLTQQSTSKTALLDTALWKLHGSLTQNERTRIYNSFISSAEGLLFCTDVAARGLDLPEVDTIVQYDPPEDVSDYVHRVGRTARMGRKGYAILFLTNSEIDYLTILKQQHHIQPTSLNFSSILQSLHSDASKNRIYDDARGGTPASAMLQKQFEQLIHSNPELHENAINAYHAFLRAYAAYPKVLKSIFHPKKLHIGHVARAFSLNEAPTQLAKSEIVSKQKKQYERKENEYRSGSSSSNKKSPSNKKSSTASSSTATSASSASSDSDITVLRPAFGSRDRTRNLVAITKDEARKQNKNNSKKSARQKEKENALTIAWKIGSEQHHTSSSSASSSKNHGIDRIRTSKIAQVFRKKKMDLAEEFGS